MNNVCFNKKTGQFVLDESTGWFVTDDIVKIPEGGGILKISCDITEEDLSLLRNEHAYRRVVLYYCNIDNIDFLPTSASNLKDLIIHGNVLDITALEHMTCLTSLYLDSFKKTKIDFSKIKKLENFDADPYIKSFNNILDTKSLRRLCLRKYPEKDLKKLANLRDLEYLDLRFGSLTSLDGIEELPSLQKITISYLRNLVDIKALGKVKKLNYLEIAKTPKLTPDDVIKQIPTAVRYRHPMVFYTDNKDYKAIPIEYGGELNIA
jgi:Leucine-rich repeat (LRR) protein